MGKVTTHDVHVFVLMSDGHRDMFGIGGLYHDTDGIDDVGGYFVVPWTFIPTPQEVPLMITTNKK